jgi:signal transduction histidine kinase
MKETKPITALPQSTTVLDEIGTGLVLVDQDGGVGMTNKIATELINRRVNKTTLLEEIIERAKINAPEPTPREESPSSEPSDQRLIEAFDASGRKSIIGYRFVRSPTFGTIFTLRDITELERFRAERRQLERLSQVGKACAMVAHEIGNPLAAIKATIQSIEREAAAAGLQDPISAVYREIDRLDKILAQLLGFVRHRSPRKVRTDIVAVVAKAKSQADAKLKNIIFKTTYGVMQPIYADPDQIQQVLLNLFLNAADAMPDGGTLSVKAELQAESHGERMVIRVDDEGVGIPPELREKVFESFYTTKPTGTGLGLSVCYRIVSDHGGSIDVEGRESKGTSILITLPISKNA